MLNVALYFLFLTEAYISVEELVLNVQLPSLKDETKTDVLFFQSLAILM